jgi:hypothetical protein
MSDQYVPGSNQKAESLMRAVARKHGIRISFNSRGDWLCYNRRRFIGVIVNIDSEFTPGSPSPIGSKYTSAYKHEVEGLRGAMNDALMEAGILEPAKAA